MFDILINLVRYAEIIEDTEWTENGNNFRRRVFKEETGIKTTVTMKDGEIISIE